MTLLSQWYNIVLWRMFDSTCEATNAITGIDFFCCRFSFLSVDWHQFIIHSLQLPRSKLFFVAHSVGVLLLVWSWWACVQRGLYLFFSFLKKLVHVLKVSLISMPRWQLLFSLLSFFVFAHTHSTSCTFVVVYICEIYLNFSIHDVEPWNFIVTCRFSGQNLKPFDFNVGEWFFIICTLTQVCLVGHKLTSFK